MDPDHGDLNHASCVVAECIDQVETIGVGVATVPPEIGAVEDAFTLELPLCANHAHLFRSGIRSFDLDSRE